MSVEILLLVVVVIVGVVWGTRRGRAASSSTSPPAPDPLPVSPPPSSGPARPANDPVVFLVRQVTEVYGPDRTTVIGQVRPGLQYQAAGSDDEWVWLASPDGGLGYIRLTEVTPRGGAEGDTP